MERKVYTGIDFFKVIAAIGIVAIHTNAKFLNTFGGLGVPFFLTVSSFFFFSKYSTLGKQDRKEYLFPKFQE